MVPGPKRAKVVRSIAHVPSGFFWATTVPRPKSRYTRPFVPLAAPKVDCSGSVSMPANAASRTNLPEGASNRAEILLFGPDEEQRRARDVEDLRAPLR